MGFGVRTRIWRSAAFSDVNYGLIGFVVFVDRLVPPELELAQRATTLAVTRLSNMADVLTTLKHEGSKTFALYLTFSTRSRIPTSEFVASTRGHQLNT